MPSDGHVVPTHWGECEIRGPVHLFRERLLLRLLRRHLACGRVLDAGCGSGSLSLDLARAGFAVEAVDASEEFVELVRGRMARSSASARLHVKLGSVTDLDFEDQCFDGVVCGEVLEHVLPEDGGDVAALAEFARVLRPGGVCALSVPLNPGLWDHTDAWARHVKRYTSGELRTLMRDQGFEVLVLRSWGFPLGRLYHRFLFAPWLRRSQGQSAEEREQRRDSRAARQPVLVACVALALRVDELFGKLPWGRGAVVVARRSE